MTNRFGLRIALAASLAMIPAGLAAQAPEVSADNTPYGATSGEFLLLGAGARGTALGNAYSVLATDVSALYYNPAGLALMSRPGAMVGSYDYVADTKYTWGGIAFPFGGGSRAIGLQLGTFGFKDQPVYTVDQPDGTGSVYSVSETFAGLTLAQNFSDRFSAGITAKVVSDQLGDAQGSAFAIDFGTHFHAMLGQKPIKLAFSVLNLGPGLSYHGSALNTNAPRDQPAGEDEVPSQDQPATLRTKAFPLPTTFRVSLGYDLVSSTASRFSLIGEFNQPNNNRAGFSLGGEYAWNRLGGSNFGVALRGSYSYASANNGTDEGLSGAVGTATSDEASLQGLAGGGGINYASGNFNLGFDYALKYMGILGPTNFFSVSLGW
ncbi:MAG TPA: PorV/PorQ family protein [Gemmatimonadales bacterium]|nr:PorV/PorQ family protein [Gemmatimonadales bacterium]